MKTTIFVASVLALGIVQPAAAETKTATVNAISASGIGASLGTITFRDTPQGLFVEPKLTGLPPGRRGFHIHENANCGPGQRDGQAVAGLAAGGHYDPAKTGKHLGPHEKAGHLGDVPILVVGADGAATLPVLAPRLKAKDLTGRAIMIHAGGDNYSDQPEPLGGGGGRVACGVIK